MVLSHLAPRLDPDLLPLFRELGELKRITSAGRSGSIADRLFANAWRELVGGSSLTHIAYAATARALVATRLGDLDSDKLNELGVAAARRGDILRAALDQLAMPLDAGLVGELRRALADDAPALGYAQCAAPAFVAALAAQPRAGVTCPGKPRLMLQPAENHAEHSLVVAVYAMLLSPIYDADAGTAFLAAMAHHLHSAAMPDSGYAGEILLGDDLLPVITAARNQAMAQIPRVLHRPIADALALIADDVAPEAQAFHAADAIDRVLEIEHHLRSGEATMRTVLDDYRLVHDGPVKPFHDRILAEIGLS